LPGAPGSEVFSRVLHHRNQSFAAAPAPAKSQNQGQRLREGPGRVSSTRRGGSATREVVELHACFGAPGRPARVDTRAECCLEPQELDFAGVLRRQPRPRSAPGNPPRDTDPCVPPPGTRPRPREPPPNPASRTCPGTQPGTRSRPQTGLPQVPQPSVTTRSSSSMSSSLVVRIIGRGRGRPALRSTRASNRFS